jgi:ribosomal protein S18 acetylase RimI-like enzyme
LKEWLSWLDRNKTVDDQRNFCKFVAENTISPDDRSSFSCVLITTTEEKEGEDVDVDDDNNRHEESKKNFIIIGEVSFEKINQTIKTGIIGYWLATKYQGKGIASAAADSIIKYGFDIFKFDYIALQVEVENYASQAIPNRLGFERLSLESTGRITENLYGKEIVLSTYVKSSPYIVIVDEEEEKEGRIPILSIKYIDWRSAGKKE